MYMKSKRQVCPKPFPRGRQKGRVHPHGHAPIFLSTAEPAASASAKASTAATRKSSAPGATEATSTERAGGEAAAAGTTGEAAASRSTGKTAPSGAAARTRKAAEASTAGPSRSPWRRRRGRLTPPPAVPAVRGAVPEQNRPEHIGRIDHSVISLTISGIARAVNQGGRHQRDGQKNDQHHYQPPRSSGRRHSDWRCPDSPGRSCPHKIG